MIKLLILITFYYFSLNFRHNFKSLSPLELMSEIQAIIILSGEN